MLTIFGYDSAIHKCVFCDNAKRLADAKKVPYSFHSVVYDKGPDGPIFDDAVVADLLQRLGRESKTGLTMPQIFWNDELIGGFEDLRVKIKDLK